MKIRNLTLRSGDLAYVDTLFSGLLPCKVLSIVPTQFGQDITVKYTARRGAYKRGETETWRASSVVPRAAVRFRKYGTRILGYNVECDA